MRIKITTTDGKFFFFVIGNEPKEIGGEGRIYEFTRPNYGHCFLKIYKTKEKAEKNERKVRYLFSNEPPHPNDHIRYCWPIGIAEEEKSGTFCGFMMQSAFENSRDLTILSNYTIGQTIAEEYPDAIEWHVKYELNSIRGLRNRMRVLYNWAIAIDALHQKRKYCLVDIKHENVFVDSKGEISIIDMDSIQVMTKVKIDDPSSSHHAFFRATAYTPNYFSPEGYDEWKKGLPLSQSSDSFSYGCCAYQVLTGTHPYTNVILLEPYNNGDYYSLSKRIRASLYLRGKLRDKIKHVDPVYDLQANFDRLPSNIKRLFNRTFITINNRPTMAEWIVELKKAIRML